jgi:hypothetical protein
VINHPGVTAALVGTRTMEQLESYLSELQVGELFSLGIVQGYVRGAEVLFEVIDGSGARDQEYMRTQVQQPR